MLLLFLFTSSCPIISSLSHEPQYEAASSAVFLTKTTLSVNCLSMVFRSITVASFSLAILRHVSLSVSAFLTHSWSSIVLIVARAKSSSFCLIKLDVFDSILLKMTASSCFLCSCRDSLNLSYCSDKKTKG